MIERRSGVDRRELPERRKADIPVDNDRRSIKTRRITGERRIGIDRRVFWDKRSPINRRRAKEKRKVNLPVIIEQRAVKERRSGKDRRAIRRRQR
jgi:hypothetical protein